MVLSSVEVCMDSVDWTQSFCPSLCKPVLPEDVMPRPPLMPERRSKPQPEQALKCPRCDSTNTKFCYYNNYNLSQPRHFCKACRRYWTKGGALRNVPVGGGCRKNKRAKKTPAVDPPSVTCQSEASTSTVTAQSAAQDLANRSSFDATIPTSDPLYFTSSALSLTAIPFTRLPQDPSFICGTQEPQASSLSSISNLSVVNPFKTTNPALDFTTLNRDQNSLFDPTQPQLSRSLASALFMAPPSLEADPDLAWKLQQQQQPPKLCFPLEDGQLSGTEAQDFLPFEQHAVDNASSSDQKSDVAKILPSSAVKDEQNTLAPDWQVPPPESLFPGDSTPYWNGGSWADISSFGASITQLL
eukprot:TRINITY_DN7268_c0_g2_i1.p1 TRINITY_DN7268_c0_g2~~TRINITY_DN7268_c0_g2_i1.p1  ORF type:complete len:356 (+),score=24.69 TRINITY_DN7268_c0_g2_i1:401-1468(+)